jgi:sortase A
VPPLTTPQGSRLTEKDRSTRTGRRSRWGYRVLISLGILLVAAAVTWQVEATLWTTHSERVGRALIAKVQKARHHAAEAPTCTAVSPSTGPQGLLVIPAIGLTAPVEQGTDDAELSVAVGHVPTSVWPGVAGNTVLEAHDVSYFVNIDKLNPGDTISYETPCATYVYTVQSHQVVAQGATVYNTPTPTMSLLTCWPTDALWFTPSRYMVTASEVQTIPNTSANSIGSVSAAATAPAVPAPAPLAAQGLTLATNSVLMGTMTVAGQPDPTWVEGPGPLAVEDSAVESFIAGVKTLEQKQPAWWEAIAPHVPVPSPMVGADVTAWDGSLDVTVTASGTTATGVQLADTAIVAGGPAPGRYTVNVTQAVTGGQLLITGWTLQRA